MEDKINSESSNNFMLNKYPYLCSTSNLIDNFMIIGYDDEVKNKEIYKEIEAIVKGEKSPSDSKLGQGELNYFSVFCNEFQPSILSTVCSRDPSKVMLDNEMITRLIFPTPPPVYYILDEQKSNLKKYEPNQYSVVFFMNSDTLEAKSKIPFHGYTFIFYERKEEKVDLKTFSGTDSKTLRVYIPKAFCIISQFAFFSQFFSLAKSIHEQMQPERNVEIPLEILIYNIINFTPAPINRALNISFFPGTDLSKIKTDDKSQNPNSQSSSSQVGLILEEKEKEKEKPEKGPSDAKHEKKDKEKEPQPNFCCLSGYPLFDFNLQEIFNILPLENIVEILIFNFLEIDMLFFSKNIEVLNLVMYIVASFNYPCNDSIYLWHIVSVSKQELEDSSANSKFIGKPFTTMVGVNCTYDEKNIETSNFTKSMFIADLDKKEFLFKYNQHMDTNDSEETQKLIKVYLYIDKIINDKSLNSKCELERNIKKLVVELDQICKKVIHANYNHGSQIIPKFLVSEVNYQPNKKTQEIFYSFILNLLKNFYKNYKISSYDYDDLKTGLKTKEYKLEYKKDDSMLPEEEMIFYEMFTSCTKYNSYMINFLNQHTTMELYHIPLIFSEEFLQLKKTNEDEFLNAKHFELMDRFYIKELKPEVFNFNEFYSYYKKELREKFENTIVESAVIQPLKKKQTKSKQFFQYKRIEMDNNVLYNYIYHLTNLPEEKLNQIFPSIARLDTSSIKRVRYNEISQIIELGYIMDKVFTKSDLISLSFIIFYSLTIHFMSEEEFNQSFEVIFELMIKQKYCLRRYITMLVSIYYRYAKLLQRNNKDYKHLLISYHRIMELALVRKINGNEEMQKIFKDFLAIDNQGIDYSLVLNKTNFREDEFNKNNDQSNNLNPPVNSEEKVLEKLQEKPQEKCLDKEKNQRKESQGTESKPFSPQTHCEENLQSHPVTSTISNFKGNDTEFKKKTDKTEFLIFLTQNLCRDGVKNKDFVLRMANDVYFEHEVNIKCPQCLMQIKPKIKFKSKKVSIEIDGDLLMPRRVYNICNNLMNAFLTDFNPESFDVMTLRTILLNLLFYQSCFKEQKEQKKELEIENPLLIKWDYFIQNITK